MKVNSVPPIINVQPVVQKKSEEVSKAEVTSQKFVLPEHDINTIKAIAMMSEVDNHKKMEEIKQKIRDGVYDSEEIAELISRALITGTAFN